MPLRSMQPVQNFRTDTRFYFDATHSEHAHYVFLFKPSARTKTQKRRQIIIPALFAALGANYGASVAHSAQDRPSKKTEGAHTTNQPK